MKANERTLSFIRGLISIFNLRPETETVFFNRLNPGTRPHFPFMQSTIGLDFEVVGSDIRAAIAACSSDLNVKETESAIYRFQQPQYFSHQSRRGVTREIATRV